MHHHLGASGNAWVADIQIGANSGVDRTGAPIPPPDYGIQFNSGHWATPFVALGVLDSSTSFPATINLLGVQNSFRAGRKIEVVANCFGIEASQCNRIAQIVQK